MLVLKKIFQYYFLAFVFIIFSHSTNNGISSKENDFLVSFDKVKLVEKKKETDLDEIIVSNSPFLLRLTFKGKEEFEDNLQKIVKFGLDNFNYKFAGKSFQTISTNGVIQKSTSIDFSLTSKKDGTCKLGPFNLSTKDQNYYWPAVKVTVKKEEQSYCFAKQELNLKNLYVGQKGLLAIKCYFDPKKVMANTINVNFSRPQDLETKYINSEDTSEVIDGKEYLVKKYFVSLISNVPGVHTIPCHEIVFQEIEEKDLSSSSRQDELENFFFGFLQDRGTTKFIRTNNINIEVKPIPISDDEAISTIGEFSALELRLSSKKCRQSEPVTIKLSLTGNSTFEAITHPELSLPEFIKHYESKSDFHSSSKTNGQGFGTKEFEYILQIDSSGEINIPQQHFKYFDPSAGTFKTISSNSAKIFVEGDTLTSIIGQAEPLKVNLDQSKDQEVINIKKYEEEFKFKNIKNEKLGNPFFAANNKIPDFIFWILFLASGFLAFWLLISSLIIKTYQKRYILSRTISILKQAGLKKDWVLFYKSILLYFSCKLNFDGQMMDSELIIIRLRKKNNLAAKTIEEFLSFINQCQEISFGFKKLTSTEEQALIVSAQKWIKQFDSFFKKNVFKSE